MAVSINADEVLKNLGTFTTTVLPKTIEECLEDACLLIEGQAKINCPVRDGQLRNSITHQVKGKKGEVGSNLEYAPYVEVGTGIYSTEGTGRQTAWKYKDAKGEWHTTRGMTAQPYLKPAVNNNLTEIVNCFKEKI